MNKCKLTCFFDSSSSSDEESSAKFAIVELQVTSTTLAPGPKKDSRFSGSLNGSNALPGIVASGSV
jgi:hypothetical protein